MLKEAIARFTSCANPRCPAGRVGRRLLFSGMYIGDDRYCSPDCMHGGLERRFAELLSQSTKKESLRQHRIPLGLFLMSRGDIDESTLKAALQQQRNSSGMRLGQVLIAMGAVSEDQIASAVASQWSVPVFRLNLRHVPEAVQLLPIALMERYKVVPAHFVQQRRHLHLAFAQTVDRGLLYAVEQMLGVTTEASIARESEIADLIGQAAQQDRPAEYVLRTVPERELPEMIRGYALRLRAEQIRASMCGEQLWVRASGRAATTHFLFRIPAAAPPA